MADNFDMKKFLVENQTGPYAKAKLAEGEAAYEYEKGKEAGEKEEKAKLTKEGGDEDKLPLTPKMKKFIDKVISDAKKDGEFEELVQVDYFENDLIDFILEKFDDESNYDDVSQEVKDYIKSAVSMKEDMGHDIEDAEAMKQMDFLAEYEVIYVYGEDGKCYRKDDEGNYDQVDRSYCQRYAGSGVREEKEKANIATNSNLPTTDKLGLLGAFQEIEELLEDLGADIEMEMDDRYVSDYSKRRAQELDEAMDAKSFGGILKSDNPEGDALVLRFLQGIAKKFEYPVSHAAMFVKERIKKLGY